MPSRDVACGSEARRRRVGAGVLVCWALAAGPSGSTAAAELLIDTPGASFTTVVTSIAERRFQKTIKQQYDFSCGSAALATLLTFHYQDPVGENAVFRSMYQAGNKELIRAAGFSLLDMKRYLETHGYRADGFRFSLDMVATVGVPAIVLINDEGYKHFVVLKGVTKEHVLLGDPARGTRTMLRGQFEGQWNGIVFVIRNKRDVGMRYFNDRAELATAAVAPLDLSVVRPGLSDFTLGLPGRLEF